MRKINFFSEYQGREKEQNNTLSYLFMASILLFVGYTYATNSIIISGLGSEISDIEAKLNSEEVQAQMALSDEVNEKIDILTVVNTGLSDVLAAVNTREVVSVNILNSLSETLPSDVSFKNLTITNGNLAIQAISKSRSAIAEVEYNLRELNMISDVYISGISEMGGVEGTYTFDLRCVLVGGANHE